MCNSRAAGSNFRIYHSAECLTNNEVEPNHRSSSRTNSMVKSRVVLFSRISDKKDSQEHMTSCQDRECLCTKKFENSDRIDIDSSTEWSSDGTDDDESRWTNIKQTASSSYVSHEELSALKGCVTRRRALFSPKSSWEASSLTLPAPTPELPCFDFERKPHHHSECDHLKDNLLTTSVSNPVPDSVSVQFDSACYDSETVCESTSKRHQRRHTGLNVAAISRSECNIDGKSIDANRQCLADTLLSCSIPGELNVSSSQREERSRFPDLEEDLHHPHSWGLPLIHAKNKSLYSSWPCRQFCQCTKGKSTSSLCSVKRTPHLTTSSAPYQITPLLQTKQRPFYPHFLSNRGNPCMGMIPSFSSSLDVGSTLSVSSCHSTSDPSLSLNGRQHISYSTGVDGQVFKDKTEMFLTWFEEFSDQQRNMLLHKLLERCDCAQMHFLSLQMEPILHNGCPHNCEDLISWLPFDIATRVLSYLDPVSLCYASKVCHTWYNLASQQNLWKALCKLNSWQFSLKGEIEQLERYTLPDCTIQWKEMFAERFRIRRNWRKGYCNVRTFEGHTQGISCIQFDNTRIVSGSWDKTIKMDEFGRHFMDGADSRSSTVWNRRTNTAWAALTLAGHSGTVRCLHLHGNRLVSGSSDRTIKVWDLATDKVGWVGAACRATMVGHLHTVRCLQADDDKVISGSYDLTLKVWNIRTGYCQQTLRGHTDAVLCLQFDGHKLVSGSKDTTIKIWSLQGGVCELTLHGHEAAVSCLQFDETRIISGALDRLIKIWNITNGECLRTIDWIRSEGHTGVVRHLQADRWKIVSAADDKTLKIWSAYTGDRLLTLKSHTDGVTCLQFDDKVIVSGSYDKTVKLWDFSAC